MSEGEGTPSGVQDPGSGGQPQGNWYDGFSETTKNLVMDRQWESPESVVESYANLEKLTGVPPDRLLKLPKDGEDMTPVWSRLGRPDTAEGYELTKEGRDAKLTEWAGKTFHELGLPKSMAGKLIEKYEEFSAEMLNGEESSYQDNLKAQADSLKKEWGAAFDQNIGFAKSAAAKLGMDAAKIDALERVLGFDGTLKLFHDIGSRTGESEYVSGGSTPAGVMTPAAARARIDSLRADPEFVRNYTAGNVSARAEMEKLHKWAYPETDS